MLFTITRLISRLASKASEKFVLVNDLLNEPREKRKTLKSCLSFAHGALIGLSFYNFVLNPFGIEYCWKVVAASVICLICALLASTSVQFRCISLLVWFEGFSRTGRSLIKALVIAFVLVGPIKNIILNANESGRVIECTSHLAYNLTKTKLDLAVKPFTNGFSHMQSNMNDVKKTFHEVRNVIEPIFDEIEQKMPFQQDG